MEINILTLPQFTRLNIEAPRGHENSGGGMSSIFNSAKAALSESWTVRFCTEVDDLTGDLVIVDPIYFLSPHLADGKLNALDTNRKENPNRRYILWAIEKSLVRLLKRRRDYLLWLVDMLVVSTPYLYNLLGAVGVTPYGYLCDSVDPNLFRPGKKEMQVTAVGALKHIKNVDWIIEVFALLEGKIDRTYLGSSVLWSDEQRDEDLVLVDKIKRVTDSYYPNESLIDVAYRNKNAAFAVNDTWHDCSSRSNEELLMCGVISIHGPHDMFTPRPGFRVTTPQEAVDQIALLTQDFTELPDPKLHEQARDWALAHLSSDVFLNQFNALLKNFV